MRLTPHLSFDGRCEAAFRFYEQCLGGKILMMMTHGESPMADQTPPEWRSKIMHATIDVGGQVLMGGDPAPEHYQKPQGFGIALHIDRAEEADRIFPLLAENGAVQMPLQETFWAQRFGALVDQFGIPWLINCEKEAPS